MAYSWLLPSLAVACAHKETIFYLQPQWASVWELDSSPTNTAETWIPNFLEASFLSSGFHTNEYLFLSQVILRTPLWLVSFIIQFRWKPTPYIWPAWLWPAQIPQSDSTSVLDNP